MYALKRLGGSLFRRARFAIAGLCLVVLTIGAAVAPSGDGGSDHAVTAGIDPDTRAILGVFARSRTDADVLPGDPVSTLQELGDAQPGEDLSQSRRVQLAPGHAAYVWPKADGVCYGSPGGSGCVPIDRIHERGVAVALKGVIRRDDLRYVDVRLFGLARDGINSIEIALAGGREVVVPVRDNVFFADTGDMPQEIRWVDSAGKHREPIETLSAEQLDQLRAP